MIAACREFRRWGAGPRAEFGLLFGTPVPASGQRRAPMSSPKCARQFSGVFFALFLELWRKQPFPSRRTTRSTPACVSSWRATGGLGTDLPVGARLIFLRCWVRLYGMVSMEVFGHLGFALEDAAPMFEITLAELARLVNLEYPAPAR